MFAAKCSLFIPASLALLLAASAAAQGVTPILTSTSYPWCYSFSPVGVAFSETLQVSVTTQPVTYLEISPVGICSLCVTTVIPTTTVTTSTSTTTTAPTPSCTGTITFAN